MRIFSQHIDILYSNERKKEFFIEKVLRVIVVIKLCRKLLKIVDFHSLDVCICYYTKISECRPLY